eukprot:GEMP01015969.1.p1 GENE.GEMP01015969.1~~GEMP01015969.1.p1  ORF type:complete len:399 (+),score=59.47 GEMP01015969.1:716-1912(+)
MPASSRGHSRMRADAMTAVHRPDGSVWWVDASEIPRSRSPSRSPSPPRKTGFRQPKPGPRAVAVRRPDGSMWHVEPPQRAKPKTQPQTEQGKPVSTVVAEASVLRLPSSAISSPHVLLNKKKSAQNASVLIYVFRNGDKSHQGTSIFLRNPKSIDEVLLQVQQKIPPLRGKTTRLLTQDIRQVTKLERLKSQHWYLAMGNEPLWPPMLFVKNVPKLRHSPSKKTPITITATADTVGQTHTATTPPAPSSETTFPTTPVRPAAAAPSPYSTSFATQEQQPRSLAPLPIEHPKTQDCYTMGSASLTTSTARQLPRESPRLTTTLHHPQISPQLTTATQQPSVGLTNLLSSNTSSPFRQPGNAVPTPSATGYASSSFTTFTPQQSMAQSRFAPTPAVTSTV